MANLRIYVCQCCCSSGSSENSRLAAFTWLGELVRIISFVNLLSRLLETSFFFRSSRLHCALQQTHTNASTHGCTGCLKIDEYYFSYKFQSDFSLADNNTIFYITYDIYWCVLCYFTSYNNMHLHIFIYFYIIIYFIILYIINYKSILSYITLYIVHNIVKQD